MRDWEEDFDFDDDSRFIGTRGCRIDRYKPLNFDPNRDKNVEQQIRIEAHIERVQREMRMLRISEGRFV